MGRYERVGVLNRAYLVPHRSNRYPLTPNRPRIPFAPGRDQRPCWSAGGEMSGMRSGTSSLRETKPDPMPTADRDGQPYLKEIEYGLQSAEC